MSTSADHAAVVVIRPYDHPDSAALICDLQADYVRRYGGPDATPTDPAEFAVPEGTFLVAYADGRPVACGGWRRRTTGVAEIKRMYVVAASRRHGLATLVLHELERTADAAGIEEIWLETAAEQPEAIAFYAAEGYAAIAPFGLYRDEPGSIHLGKRLGETGAVSRG